MNAEIKKQLIARLQCRVTFVDAVFDDMQLFGQDARVDEFIDKPAEVYADNFAAGLGDTIESNGFTHAAHLEVATNMDAGGRRASLYLGKRDSSM